MFQSVHSVMMFVANVEEASAWYAQLLEKEREYLLPNFPIIRVGSTELCFHKADSKVPSGRAGVVTYWKVDSLAKTMARARELQAEIYRGPLAIEDGQAICQVTDPFGNLFGLVGPNDI